MYTLLIAVAAYILHLNVAVLVNVEVTLNKKEAFTLFSHEEIWGFQYVNQTADMVQLNVVINESKSLVLRSLLKKGVVKAFDMIYPNVEEVIQKERDRLSKITKWKSGDAADPFFDDFRQWDEYEAFLNDLVATYSFATQEYIGTTIQGRNIPLITLSTGGSGNRPAFYIQAALHAREWLANAATTYILNALAEGYGNDAGITTALDSVDFYFVPTVNVDGYIYSWTTSRMWRKNRRANSGGTFGVDLNRNYQAPSWCQVGASTNPNSDTYCGTSPNSEPETAATVQFLNDHNNIGAVFDMHTYGPLILYPWAYTYSQASDYTYLRDLGAELSTAVHNVNGHRYTSQQAADLYPCAGTMVDHAYAEGVLNSITFEGRGPGFNPSATNIVPAGEEQLAAVLVIADRLAN